MDGQTQARRLRSFLIGSAVGASAVLAAARRRGRHRDRCPVGLGLFQGAPCYQETMEERQQAPS
jgi:hypothetical protein